MTGKRVSLAPDAAGAAFAAAPAILRAQSRAHVQAMPRGRLAVMKEREGVIPDYMAGAPNFEGKAAFVAEGIVPRETPVGELYTRTFVS